MQLRRLFTLNVRSIDRSAARSAPISAGTETWKSQRHTQHMNYQSKISHSRKKAENRPFFLGLGKINTFAPGSVCLSALKRSRQIGNRVKVPDSPAAVRFRFVRHDLSPLAPRREGRRTGTSQKTCRFVSRFGASWVRLRNMQIVKSERQRVDRMSGPSFAEETKRVIDRRAW